MPVWFRLKFSYPPELPITARLPDIAALFRAHQVLVIAGETGSGKTTQLPKLCLDILREQQTDGAQRILVGHTQPRRLAARTVANRIAEELGETVGHTVGCQVRFQDTTSDATQIKLMTDGILLAEIQRDRLLKKYTVLILDEAHERSLNIDFLLGYLKQILPKRPDLKVLVTSATLDVERFAAHFGNAPVVVVEGRGFPVEMVYLPPDEMPGKPEDAGAAIQQAFAWLCDQERQAGGRRGGDVLVFLSSERDILDAAQYLRRQQMHDNHLRHCEVVPLYARLSLAEQQRVFAPHTGRRVVLATNVAETSLTVPGIRYVIDGGDARISRYSHRSRVQRLPIEAVSQASANQRAGRCGRLEAGVCVRLYSERDFQSRPPYTDPEIRRTNLASVVLQMLLLRLGSVEAFPFVDPPDPRHIHDAYALLAELGAVDAERRITPQGREMARLPVDPRLAAMLLAAKQRHCLAEVLVIAGGLSVQDPRERPVDRKQQADECHRQWADDRSDFVSYLMLWQAFETQRQALSQNALRRYCGKQFLSWQRMREWRDVVHQLRLACQQLGWKDTTLPDNYAVTLPPAAYANLHQALLVGCLSSIAQRQDKREYLGCRQRKLQVFPGSPQAKKAPRWIMAASWIETSQLFAHCVAMIEPQWVLPVAKPLLQHSYAEPFWDAQRGMPMIYQKTSLYGLVLVERQKRFLGEIDAAAAHELFIREALVAGHYTGKAAFFHENQEVLVAVKTLEDRTRRRDLLVDEHALFAFYQRHVPPHICTVRDMEAWYHKANQQDAANLRLRREDVLLRDPGDDTVAQFPDQWTWQGNHLRLHYSFDPGHEQDGVSLQVPLALLNQIPTARLSWLVPGLLADKCQALLRQLPKQQRKELVPLPNTAMRLAALLPQSPTDQEAETLPLALCELLWRHYGLKLLPDSFDETALDPFYRMNVQVLGERNTVLMQGRDIAVLRAACREQVREVIQEAAPTAFQRTSITRWDIDTLPTELPRQQGNLRVVAYPALRDEGNSVALCLCDSEVEAEQHTRQAVVRLALLALPQQVKYLRDTCLKDNRVRLVFGKVAGDAVLRDDLVQAVFAHCLGAQPLPRTASSFDAAVTTAKENIVSTAQALDQALAHSAARWQTIEQRLAVLIAPDAQVAVDDIRHQLACLFRPAFLRETPLPAVLDYPRYLEGITQRLERMRGQVARDREATRQLQRYWKPLAARLGQSPLQTWSLPQQTVRWLLEEWRIGLFAQPMKTRMPVSEKRVREAWEQTGWPPV